MSADTQEEQQSTSSNRSNPNIYVQIATPKSPNSDGYSPQDISEFNHVDSIENDIKQKLSDEIDIEILLKHREYNMIQAEISKVEASLTTLTKIHDDDEYVKYLQSLIQANTPDPSIASQPQLSNPISTNEWQPSIRKSSLRHQSSDNDSSSPPKQPRTSYGGLRPVIDANGNKICVHKRSDGVIVRIECPICGRTDFGSAQGFLNHARLAHQIEYKSQDHAALMCGTIMEDKEQDEVGRLSILKLNGLKLNPDRNLAPGVELIEYDNNNQPIKKKRKSSSYSKNEKTSGFLEKLYKENTGDDEDSFKSLVENVTTKVNIELDEDTTIDSNNTEMNSILSSSSNFKKNHNRRKSRGGLSAVTFDESSFNNIRPSSSSVIDVDLNSDSIKQSTQDSELQNSSDIDENGSMVGYETRLKLTAAQRRRVPTIPNPLRTRSRSSRENSR